MGGVMTVPEAFRDIARALQRADRAQRAMMLPPVSDDHSKTWSAWQCELDFRVNKIASEIAQYGRPTQVMLDSLGAQIIGLKLAVARAEDADHTTGDEASAA